MSSYLSDPDELLKNVITIPAAKGRDRFAIVSWNDTSKTYNYSIQTFTLKLDGEFLPQKVITGLEKLMQDLILSHKNLTREGTPVVVFVIHESMMYARDIMDIIVDLPYQGGLVPAAAYISDTTTWFDIFQERVGKLNPAILTEYQWDVLMKGILGA